MNAKCDLQDIKHVDTSMVSSKLMSKIDGVALDDPSEYRSVVGALQYLTLTKPEISFSINRLYQFMAQPFDYHWFVVKYIFQYINDTLRHGLLILLHWILSLSVMQIGEGVSMIER